MTTKVYEHVSASVPRSPKDFEHLRFIESFVDDGSTNDGFRSTMAAQAARTSYAGQGGGRVNYPMVSVGVAGGSGSHTTATALPSVALARPLLCRQRVLAHGGPNPTG